MKDLKKDLIEIRKNIFVSKNDPEFLKKYVKYNPTDSQKLYEYAKELESQGETLKAYEYFEKAARFGHFKATKILENTAKTVVVAPVAKEEKPTPPKKSYGPLLLILLLLSLFLFGFLLYYLFSNLFDLNKTNETHIFEQHHTTVNLANDSSTRPEELVFVTLHSAIEYYQDINGVYPITLDKLTSSAPQNYLSFIPDAVSYEKTTSGFSLSVEGIDGNAKTVDGLLSLVFYEKTNQLGVLKGEELLALYPVASGKSEIPPAESFVSRRVVDPNGGDGVLGTRGFALTDNFAIHGTNDEDSIGKEVTSGCLRMKKEDIETLFPYIPLGTPFYVEKETKPGEPSLPGGFPPFPRLPENNDFSDETTPNITYHWKY